VPCDGAEDSDVTDSRPGRSNRATQTYTVGEVTHARIEMGDCDEHDHRVRSAFLRRRAVGQR